MGGDDTKIKSLDTIIKHIGYINQNKRSQVDPSLFLSVLSPKDAHASLIDKKVLKNGILLLTASGNEGVGVHMRYLSKKGNTISAVKG